MRRPAESLAGEEMKLSRGLCFVSSLGALVTVALGAAPEPTLEKKGKLLLLDENFEAKPKESKFDPFSAPTEIWPMRSK